MFQSPDSGDLIHLATRRVLVVDDEPTLRLGFSYALSSKTTYVETAGTGRQALDTTAKADFDVIILDLRMPDIDGLGVIKSLRNVGIQTPIVLCSAGLNSNSTMQALLNGVVDFLHKPICPAELRGVVNFILSPSNQPFSKAMRAAREGAYDVAIDLLNQAASPDIQTQAWADIFTLLLNEKHKGETFLLEQHVNKHLNLLAYREPGAV